MSRYIRKYLQQELPALDAMIALQHRLREKLKSAEPDQSRRKAILRRVLEDPAIWKNLGEDQEKAWDLVVTRYLHD